MAGVIREHRKSRKGCIQCKQRKIKCDETKPCCQQCDKYDMQCSYLQTELQQSAYISPPLPEDLSNHGSLHSSGRPSSTIFKHDSIHGSLSRGGEYSAFLNPVSYMQSLPLNMRDLELLHFYTTSTSTTLSAFGHIQAVWQLAVPKIAVGHPFLMHGVLASAALHLASLLPARKSSLMIEAYSHHSIALSTFRSVMANITQENCTAVFAFSSLLVVYACASPRPPNSLFFTDHASRFSEIPEGAVEWIRLLRGVHTVLQSAWSWIEDSPLGPIIRPGKYASVEPKTQFEHEAPLSKLATLWRGDIAAVASEDAAVYDITLQQLKEAFVNMDSSRGDTICPISAAMIWPIMVPDAYIELVGNRTPEALVLLAHYCPVLQTVRSYWWMNGMAADLLKTIRDILVGDWKAWIEWPLSQVDLGC